MAPVDDALDQVDHVGDVPGGPWLVSGGEGAQGLICPTELPLVDVGPLPPALTGSRGLIENLVVDIGHIAHQGHLVAQAHQPAANQVEGQGGADMADMG